VPEAKSGDTVKVHYTGKLEDGTVFDTSADREPLEFTIGQGQVIPGFEKAVVGMNTGDTKTEEIPPEDAYGPHLEELILEVDIDQIPENLDPQVGQKLQMRQDDGRMAIVEVTNVSESGMTLDANHPLAGKGLTFDIQLGNID